MDTIYICTVSRFDICNPQNNTASILGVFKDREKALSMIDKDIENLLSIFGKERKEDFNRYEAKKSNNDIIINIEENGEKFCFCVSAQIEGAMLLSII